MLKRIKLDTDLCVVGGGMAGICTAIAAARTGCRVVLVHERPVLGGNASSEIRMWVSGARGKDNRETGIIEEIMLENLYRNPSKNFYLWDTVLYDFVKREKNIHLLLNCSCMDAETKQGAFAYGRDIWITKISAYQMTTQQFFDITAAYFADCSGDSILAPLTGADFRIGREAAAEYGEITHVTEADHKVMGMSCLLQGRETERKISFIPPKWSTKLTKENVTNRPMNLYNTEENFWYLELGGNRDTIHDTEAIKDELISLALGVWDYLKNQPEEQYENWELEFLGFLPGKRESRRMCGEYMVTQTDITSGKIFEDTIAFGGWPLDDHEPNGYYYRGVPNTDVQTPAPYCLPYRALYSKNVSNLFFAGRNISMTHAAMSSIRVMATCALLGQAAGTAAALAVRYDCEPHRIYLEHLQELQQELMNSDCFLPHFIREISELCRETKLSNGSALLKNGEDRVNSVYGNRRCGEVIVNQTVLEYRFTMPQKIKSVHLVLDSDLNRDTLPGDEIERSHATRANIRLNSPQMHMPATLCKEFVLEAETVCGLKQQRVSCNRKRAYHWMVEQEAFALRFIPYSNWGGSDSTRILSFDFN